MHWREKLALTGAAIVAAVVAGAQASSSATAAPRWIVFSAAPLQNAPAQLHRIRTDGTELKELTQGKAAATDPAFSPDGKRIAFVRPGSGIYAMSIDGGTPRKLTAGARDLFPVFSPNGKHIAFLRFYRSDWHVYVMSPSGRSVRRLQKGPAAGRPSWSPDGKAIYISSRGALVKINSVTGAIEHELSFLEDLPLNSAVSPNTRQVAFVASRPSIPGCGEVSCLVFALYLGDAKTGKSKRFVNDTGPPGWSPDSKMLVYAYHHGLALKPVAGGSPTTITVGSTVIAADAPPAWQP